MRKAALSAIVIFLMLMPLSARQEFWIGGDVLYDLNIPTAEVKDSLESTYGRVEMINSVGLGLDMMYFPSDKVRIGPFLDLNIIFPVGVSFDGSTEAFISYESAITGLRRRMIPIARDRWITGASGSGTR